ncbi:uncharacterized protein LOC132750508 [Ruditapes philippinarum]|uniref:uncharacterized protein LOC132750508 n=1 Tax=Ruditapes philippinarum TaxID=129788 RepID=UPI00295A67FA|nr:uncharacterized protein LOC132750508 [Ruditapes philippinarum]
MCFIHSNFAQGLHMIFPKNTDPIDDITEQSFSNQNDFEGDALDAIPEEIERRVSPLLIPDENRLMLFKQILSDVGSILSDNSLEDKERTPMKKRYSLFNHLRGAQLPFDMSPSEMPFVPMYSGFFPALHHRRYNTLRRKYKHSNSQQQQRHNFRPVLSKRKSAITPPSRDWCRLIGYRVCPRATKF